MHRKWNLINFTTFFIPFVTTAWKQERLPPKTTPHYKQKVLTTSTSPIILSTNDPHRDYEKFFKSALSQMYMLGRSGAPLPSISFLKKLGKKIKSWNLSQCMYVHRSTRWNFDLSAVTATLMAYVATPVLPHSLAEFSIPKNFVRNCSVRHIGAKSQNATKNFKKYKKRVTLRYVLKFKFCELLKTIW